VGEFDGTGVRAGVGIGLVMPRMIRLTNLVPMKITAADIPEGKAISLCTCGLSQKFPLCDGAHKRARETEQPGILYTYDANRVNIVKQEPDPEVHADGQEPLGPTLPPMA
jgi:CDGSH iron-sulfur domain-containing protein 1